jgi:integrase
MSSFLGAVEKEDQINRDFFLLLLLTGVRRGNLMAAKWEDVNLDDGLWRISAEQSKNGRAQYVRLPPAAVEILRSRTTTGDDQATFVFPADSKTGYITSPKKAWARIIARAGLLNLRPHDLRRTHASWQLAAGATLQEVGKSLNHRDIKSTLIYAHLDLDPIMRNVDQAARQMLSMHKRESDGGNETGSSLPINEDR